MSNQNNNIKLKFIKPKKKKSNKMNMEPDIASHQ